MYLIPMFILKVLRCIFCLQNASILCGLYESLIVQRFDTFHLTFSKNPARNLFTLMQTGFPNNRIQDQWTLGAFPHYDRIRNLYYAVKI